MSKKVSFNAHKTVNKPTQVSFKTKAGQQVGFTAEKPTKVPIHVSFKTKN